MKKNIILLYIVYTIIIYLLFIIDISVLMYYIFWINNIFIYPLFWLWIKIIYYNRTVLLLLLFYYLIAKFTIKEQGYKYFYFFGLDVRYLRSIYLNYMWNITTYHIEIISIYLFFFIIIIPLYLYKKEILFLISSLLLFLFYLFKIVKNRLVYIDEHGNSKKKKIKLKPLILFPFFLLVFYKIFNYQYLKDISTIYLYMDIWTFDFLEWKIQMFNKATEKDYFSKTVGLKPKWIGDKINKKDYINNKYWEYLYKKKSKKLINELKFKLKKAKKKYYIYIKYYDKVLKIKKDILYKKKKVAYKSFFFKKKENINKFTKEFPYRKYIKNENPVVTQEKERERILHRTVFPGKLFQFSIKNYYVLNNVLKDLTFDKLYYQPFFDKKGLEKHLIYEKKNHFFFFIKDRIKAREDLLLYKEIVKEIKRNKMLFKKLKVQFLLLNHKTDKDYFFIKKTLNYLNFEKEENKKNNDSFLIKKIFNKSFFKDIKFLKKKDKLNMKLFLKKTKNDIIMKKKISQLSFFYNSKKYILNNDKIYDSKQKSYNNFSKNYIERSEMEKFDNKLLFNTVKKYNEEKTKSNWKSEFNKSFILKEKKGNLKPSDSPDLSRRNRK